MTNPWFRFYGADFLLDVKVAAIPLAAQAILLRCWCLQAREGQIPADLPLLARLTGVELTDLRLHLQDVLKFFQQDGDLMFSRRLEKEREGANNLSEVRRRAAL